MAYEKKQYIKRVRVTYEKLVTCTARSSGICYVEKDQENAIDHVIEGSTVEVEVMPWREMTDIEKTLL